MDRLVPQQRSYGYVGGNPVMFGDPLGMECGENKKSKDEKSPDEIWAQYSENWAKTKLNPGKPFDMTVAYTSFPSGASETLDAIGVIISGLFPDAPEIQTA